MPRIGSTLPNSLSNGPGTRTVFFFAGCKHKCHGCQNEHLWPMDSGIRMNISDLYKTIDDNIDMIDGITISGGEPFLQPRTLFRLANYAKKKNLDVWCYTGYTVDQLIDMSHKNKHVLFALKYIDTLVDGKFEEDKKDDNLKWKGSSNQRIINLSKVVFKEEITG